MKFLRRSVCLLMMIMFSATLAWAGNEGGHGGDPVARYMNLVGGYVAPDIINTVGADQFKNGAASALYLKYATRRDQMLATLDHTVPNRVNKPLQDVDTHQVTWIATNTVPGANVDYNSDKYVSLFGQTPDLWMITEYYLHEIGHQYGMKEDQAWQFAQALMAKYVNRCHDADIPQLFQSGQPCSTYGLIEGVISHSQADGAAKGDIDHFRFINRLEKTKPGESCLEGYFGSVQNLTAKINAQDETVDLLTEQVDQFRKNLIPEEAFAGSLLLGGAGCGLGYAGAMIIGGAFSMITGGGSILGAMLFQTAVCGGSLWAGAAIDHFTVKDIIAMNNDIRAYNKTVDQAEWMLQQYGSSPNEQTLFKDRQFSYQILFESLKGSSESVQAAAAHFDPSLLAVNLPAGLDYDKVTQRLSRIANSKVLCSQGLLTSAQIGVLLSSKAVDSGITK